MRTDEDEHTRGWVHIPKGDEVMFFKRHGVVPHDHRYDGGKPGNGEQGKGNKDNKGERHTMSTTQQATTQQATTQVKNHKVLVFTTPSCPWCRKAKSYLSDKSVPFREVDVSRDPAAARDLIRRSGQMGVPVIEIDGRPVVGFDKRRIDSLLGLH
ncbi:MAG: glutaredoxin family protein [Actinobacteria bacterium]|nr:glutaredoxin family protein [Actinomycetota bacterium]